MTPTNMQWQVHILNKLKLLHVFENNLVICQNLVGKISNLKIVKKKSEI